MEELFSLRLATTRTEDLPSGRLAWLPATSATCTCWLLVLCQPLGCWPTHSLSTGVRFIDTGSRFYLREKLANDLPAISAIYRRGGVDKGNLDIVVKRNSRISEVIENVSPQDVTIYQNKPIDFENKVLFALSLQDARRYGLPANFLPVRIRGQTYFIDAGYKASPAFGSLNLVDRTA